jgi:hypothetical protein
MSKIENAETTRMLRDDELDFVSGGSSEEPTESISFNYLHRRTVSFSFGKVEVE